MKILTINALCGIKNQLYCQDQYVDSENRRTITNNFFDINSLFWSKIFDIKHISNLIERAQNELKYDESPKIQALLKKPDIFFETFLEALNVLRVAVSEKELFQGLETLEIICYLHTKLYSTPHRLTLSQGYIHSKFSAFDMEKICLLPFCNPYLTFINTEIVPPILDYQPEILILTGVPNLPAFAIAKLIKIKIPNIFIIAKDHESDYYSLQKIKNLLCKNTAFFSVYHCAVLSNYSDTINQIKQWYLDRTNNSLNDIPNIIYSLDNGINIIKTASEKHSLLDDKLKIDNHCSSYVQNIKIFPQNHCYWNQCSFCGINSKYDTIKNQTWDEKTAISRIKTLYQSGEKRFWFLDEAIPPNVLKTFATYIIEQDIHITWHIRMRIETQLIDKAFIRLLVKAGLRHILFGFESACKRILTLMEKNNCDYNYLEVAEKLVREFISEGIQVHFSAILGFPTETEEERQETIDFLRYLQNNYTLFSYNLNSFYLDIGSKIYNKWENFDILSLSFPCAPKYFLENHLDWNMAISPQQTDSIHKEQENGMVQQYPWYPKGALIDPTIFFAFWEYSRYTLYESVINKKEHESYFHSEQLIILSPKVIQCQLDDSIWMLYHLKSHHYVIGGSIILNLINADNTCTYYEFTNSYKGKYKKRAESLIMELTRKEFFI